MPANPKYLTQSNWQRFAKISAATVGGLLVAVSFHLFLAAIMADPKTVLLTYTYSLFLLWCTLMLITFLFKNGWKCWFLYGGISIVFVLLTIYLQNK